MRQGIRAWAWRRGASACAAWGLCFAAVSAQAQEPDEPPALEDDVTAQVEALSEQGAELFHQERYREAIGYFKQAYNLSPVANLLYNIALSYERIEDVPQAIFYYEKFIVAQDADPDTRGRALERARELQRRQAEAKKAEEKKVPDERQPDAKPKVSSDGLSTWGVAGIILGGAGVVLGGTGVVFGVLAQSEQNEFNTSRDLYTKQVAQTNAKNRALTADLLYLGGGVTLVSGVTLLVLDLTVLGEGEEAAPSTTWRLTPTLGPDGVGAQVGWEF